MSPDGWRIGPLLAAMALLGLSALGLVAAEGSDQAPIGVAGAEEGPLKIGAIYNLEGSQSPLDLPSSRGARLAVEEINAAGGIDGRRVELLLCDGKSDPAEVRRCSLDLAEENLSGMIGLSDTDMVVAAAPAAAGARISFLTSGATSPRLPEVYEGIFLACFGDDVQAAAGAEHAFEMGLSTCALLVDGEMEYARLLAGYFRERYQALGGEIAFEAFLNGPDNEALVQAIGEASPDMIYLAAGPDLAAEVVGEVRAAGIEVPVFGGDSLDSPELRRVGTGRIVFSAHALLDENSSRSGPFVRAYDGLYGQPPENAFAALGYDAVMLLAEAMDRAGSEDPEAIREALQKTTGFEGVTGDISYEGGRRIPKKGVTMISLKDGVIESSPVVIPSPSV